MSGERLRTSWETHDGQPARLRADAVTRYGYARVSTREQNPDSQQDALAAVGIEPGNIVIEKVSGKLASRPRLDELLGRLEAGDQVVVTRLRRIGRNHQHLLDLSAWFDQHGLGGRPTRRHQTLPPCRPRRRVSGSISSCGGGNLGITSPHHAR